MAASPATSGLKSRVPLPDRSAGAKGPVGSIFRMVASSSPLPRGLRALITVVVAVSVPEGISLLLGPQAWYSTIWGWNVTPLSARFIAGIYLSVSLGFAMAWKENDWDRARMPLAMLWSFALVALLSATVTDLLGEGTVVLSRPFTWVWIFLYVVSVVGGLFYHLTAPRTPRPVSGIS